MQQNSSVSPTNYRISLEPDLKTFRFKGTVLITINILKSTTEIILDAVNLEILTCHLLDGGSRMKLKFELNNNKLKIISDKLEQGKNEIEIEFTGELNDKLAGFYRSKYEENGKEKYIATTQFEAADARQAFPCFDEPAFKTTFDITLIVDKKYTAVSNMPVIKEVKAGEKKSVTFATTPIMSTYLLYFGVGEFEIVEESYKNILVRGVTTKGKSEHTAFSIDCAKKSLEFFEDYFDYTYPLPKLDLIAIPDFASGAMENWGAITFRENAILFYPGKSSLSTTQRVAEVVCHELAHQWFGNLVTMKWWDDLWLNESFATFMAYKVMDHYWPDWDVWTQYINATVFEGMTLDCLRSSHPIKTEVNNIAEMNELFDEIAYEKGGSVLRMIESYMGKASFKQGLRKYILKNQYKNTEAKDLWTALESIDNKNILKLIDDYITVVGFPYVKVSKNRLEQNRFLFGDSDDKTVWSIPLHMRYVDSKEESINLQDKKMILSSRQPLITINADYGAFFISHYSEDELQIIGGSISKLNSKEKIGLIHDLYYLIRFQKEKFSVFLNFVNSYLKSEKDPVVLLYLIEVLDFISSLKGIENVQSCLRYFTKKSLEITGFDPKKSERTFDTFLRSMALSCLSQLNDKEVVEFLDKKYDEYLLKPELLHPDLKTAVFQNAVWSHPENYEKIMELYKKSNIQEEKLKFLSALTNSKLEVKIKETLNFCLTSEVRFANVFYALNAGAKNPYAKEVVLDWMIHNWDEFGKRVGGHGGTLLRRFVKIVVPICGIGNEDKVNKFIHENKIPGLEKTFEQIWEELEINSKFVISLKNNG